MIYNWLARHGLATSLADQIKSNQIELNFTAQQLGPQGLTRPINGNERCTMCVNNENALIGI